MKKILIIITLILSILSIVTFAYAEGTVVEDEFDPDVYTDIYSTEGVSKLRDKAGVAINIVQIVGTAVSLIVLIVLAIRYIVSSPNEKAEIKTRLVPYVTGVIIFFGHRDHFHLEGHHDR